MVFCFIYNRFYILSQCRYYLIYIGTEAYAKPAECGSEMEVSPPPYHVPTRFCRHMGPEKKIICLWNMQISMFHLKKL